MRITDIATGRAVLESLAEKKKIQKLAEDSTQSSARVNGKDSFQSDKKVSADLAKINEVQKNYLKDHASLNGLQALEEKAAAFVSVPAGQRDYENLSKELAAIVNSTRFEGESIISYISTNVKDEKSLYTLKTNLRNEINSVQFKMSEERKNLATYLIKSENMEAAGDVSSERLLKNVTAKLDKKISENLFKGMSNLSSLLGIEK